jgi:hypothetical protein
MPYPAIALGRAPAEGGVLRADEVTAGILGGVPDV